MFARSRCRTCLVSQNLYPIMPITEHSEKYSKILQITTGLKVEMNDSMSQVICTNCITFINDSIKFRRRCKEAQNIMLSHLNNKQYFEIKSEKCFKTENEYKTSIDISELIDFDDDFKDYDDNIPLDTFQYNISVENISKKCETNNENVVIKDTTTVSTKLEPNVSKEKPSKRRVLKKEQMKVELEKAKDKPEKMEVECEYCQKVLTSKTSLRNHYKIHTGFDIVCEHCGKKFITRRLLLMHCKAKHGYEKTDKCSYCEYRGSNPEQVKIHERLHTGEKPYVCACGAGFHRKSSFLQHTAIHLPEKTVQCDQCPARFKSVTLMRIHKNRHRAPVYTFKCRVCENNFARRRNVVRHLQRIHQLTADESHIDRVKII